MPRLVEPYRTVPYPTPNYRPGVCSATVGRQNTRADHGPDKSAGRDRVRLDRADGPPHKSLRKSRFPSRVPRPRLERCPVMTTHHRTPSANYDPQAQTCRTRSAPLDRTPDLFAMTRTRHLVDLCTRALVGTGRRYDACPTPKRNLPRCDDAATHR